MSEAGNDNGEKITRLGATEKSRALVPTLMELLEDAKAGRVTFLSGFAVGHDEGVPTIKAFATDIPDDLGLIPLKGMMELSFEALRDWYRRTAF